MTASSTLAAYKARTVDSAPVDNINIGFNYFWDFAANFEGFSATGTRPTPVEPATFNIDYSSAFEYLGAVQTRIQNNNDVVNFVIGLNSSITTSVSDNVNFQARICPAAFGDPPLTTPNWRRAGAIGIFDTLDNPQGITNGAYFYFDGAISNNFICRTRFGFTIESFTTSTPVTYSDVYLKIVIAISGTYFYINNQLVFTSTQGTGLVNGGLHYVGISEKRTDAGGIVVGTTIDAFALAGLFRTVRNFT